MLEHFRVAVCSAVSFFQGPEGENHYLQTNLTFDPEDETHYLQTKLTFDPEDEKTHYIHTNLTFNPEDEKTHYLHTNLTFDPEDEKTHYLHTNLTFDPEDEKTHYLHTNLTFDPEDYPLSTNQTHIRSRGALVMDPNHWRQVLLEPRSAVLTLISQGEENDLFITKLLEKQPPDLAAAQLILSPNGTS
ncbi:UNVERIFIED_CONTAM: hypothetical protein FKN15_053074 [Acipenser sinensis]